MIIFNAEMVYLKAEPERLQIGCRVAVAGNGDVGLFENKSTLYGIILMNFMVALKP